MCNLYSLGTSGHDVAQHFGVDEVLGLAAPLPTIAPTEAALVIRTTNGEAKREAAWLRWGLIPGWAKPDFAQRPLTNARAETVADMPAFRDAWRVRRCLIPADGFYEWGAAPGAAPGRPGKRQRWRIRREDNALFAFAGLWEAWRVPEAVQPVPERVTAQGRLEFAMPSTPPLPEAAPRNTSPHGVVRLTPGQIVETCTIITTAAQPWLAPLHNRMPVVLPPDLYAGWLAPTPPDELSALLARTPEPGWMIEDAGGRRWSA